MSRSRLKSKLPEAPAGATSPAVVPDALRVVAPPIADKPEVQGELTRCTKCRSTARTKYRNRRELAHAGEINGKPYTHVVWRNTSCSDCGQNRIDVTHEMRPVGP